MSVLLGLPQVDPRSKDCVRYLPKEKRYELVVGGAVKATISRFAMTVPAARKKFHAAVLEARRERAIDALVERLFPDEDTTG